MNIALFASGSSGNCALVSDGETHILIDAGISARASARDSLRRMLRRPTSRAYS